MAILRLYMRILAQLREERTLVWTLAAANVVLAVAQFAEPVLFGRIVDVLTRAQSGGAAPTFAVLTPLIAAWIAFGLFTIGAGVMVALHADRLAHRRKLAMVATYFNHVLALPQSFHSSTHSGRVLKVMIEGTNGMAALWLSFFREHCASFVTLGLLLPATLFLNWQLGLLLLALVVVFAVLTWFVLRKTEQLQGSVERYHSDLAERASDALGNVPVIQSFTRVEAEVRALHATIDQLLRAQNPVLSWWAVASVVSRASATLTVLAVFLMGTWLNLNGKASVGEIVTFMNLATLLIGRLEQTVGFVNFIFMQGPKISEFFEVLDTSPIVASRPGAPALGQGQGQGGEHRVLGEVTFDDVSFSYDGRRPAVLDASFVARPGETIALVGATGSGKSTTLALLHRVFDPQSGRILIDGQDIRDVTLESLRQSIGVVFQEPMLFARSIRENLQAGKPDASDVEIAVALERAQASDFIARQSDGIDTIIGERGRSLSGGERQRLSIARALLKNPPILILDEATSALDAATEGKLQLALTEVMKGRTTFVIAHRLATIRDADRIFVFDKGSIVEAGSFDELVARNGAFAALARAQFMAAQAPVSGQEGFDDEVIGTA